MVQSQMHNKTTLFIAVLFLADALFIGVALFIADDAIFIARVALLDTRRFMAAFIVAR